MGVEIVLLWLGIAIASAFAVDKGVELVKHGQTLDADRYHSCVSATKDARQCRGME